MLDLTSPDNVKTTDRHPKDFLDPSEIKAFLEAAKEGRKEWDQGSFAVSNDVSPRPSL
jgi:hypothetical protein